jgi:hypothetical protein
MPGPIDNRIARPQIQPKTIQNPKASPLATPATVAAPDKPQDAFLGTTTPRQAALDSLTVLPSSFGAPPVRMVNGSAVEAARATYPQLGELAGSTLAESLQKSIDKGSVKGVPDDVVVEGPSAFSPQAHRDPPSALASLINKVAVWTVFQSATSTADRLRLGGAPAHLGLPTVPGSELVALTKELGPDGKPKLMPGDMIINGCNGATGHMSIYIGDDPTTGQPQIIHAMGTADTQQSLTMIAGNAVKAAVSDTGKVGVIQEGLAGFFDRFDRDSYVVVRDPHLTDEMRAKGLAHVKELLGKGYDYDLNMSNDKYYCSEMGVEMMKAAYAGSGQPMPWVGTTSISRATLNDQVATPENFVASPDFVLTAGNKSGWAAAESIIKTHVLGIQTPGTPAPTQADLDALLPKPDPAPSTDDNLGGGG